MQTEITDLLAYWTGPPDIDPAALKPFHDRWYAYSPATDDEIRRRFGSNLIAAEAGELDHWQQTPGGSLALVILFDQFTRNLHRGSAEAWRNDSKALEIALDMLDRGDARQLAIPGRIMLLHPLLHAEDKAAHRRLVAELEQLLKDAPAAWHEMINAHLKFARNHGSLIERFGRFPHRNQTLGRESTPEEQAFLAGDSRSYGQGET